MTLDRDETALKAALDRRRPAALPPELLERLDAIPTAVSPLRPLPARMTLALAPWAGVAAALLVLFGPGQRAVQVRSGATSPTGWSPSSPGGGLAEVGLLGVPWIAIAIGIVVYGAVESAWHVAHGRPAFGWLRLRRRGESQRVRLRDRALGIAAAILMIGALELLSSAVGTGPLNDNGIGVGSLGLPGPQVTETQAGGEGHPDDNGTGPLPRFVYRVGPATPFSFAASIRNTTWLPVTVVGISNLAPYTSTLTYTGLGLPRDPSAVSTADADVVPFHPVTLQPGEELPIVVAAVSGTCADPAGDIFPTLEVVDRDSLLSIGSYYGPGITVVYEFLGWRHEDDVAPAFEVSVPTREDCP